MTLAIDRLASQRSKFVAGPITASLEAGDCLAVMGANGAGKTTLLETLAGFSPATSGRILLDGSDITDRVPERRRIAYLPQDLALFPHLDVVQNVAFATRRRRGPGSQDEVDALIEEFGLGPLRARYPSQLSSGQAQRVAFARAVAMHPKVLLLDEPATALDLSGQRSFNTHMRKLLVDHGLIIIYATHTILDSLSPAGHLIVLDRGKMIQAGAPSALLHEPADVRVAELLGITNLWPAEILDRTAPTVRVRAAGNELSCSRLPIPRAPVFVGIGPGEVELLADAPSEATNCFKTVIHALQVSGQVALLELEGALGGLRATVPPWQAMELEVGQSLWIRLPADRLRLIPAAGQ